MTYKPPKPSGSINAFKKFDDGSSIIPYYTVPTIGTSTNAAWAINTIRAVPYPCDDPNTTIKSIGINVTTSATNGMVRLALYGDNGNMSPYQLIYDFGEVNTATTGFKAITSLSIPLQQGTLYWFCLNTKVSVTLTSFATGAVTNLLGFTTAGAAYNSCTGAFTYGAFPQTFPTSTIVTGSVPAIFVKFSS